MEADDDELDVPTLDGEGRVYGSAGACATSLEVWDDAIRVRDLAALRADAQEASWPLAATSFWLPAGAVPRCDLEALAAAIFELHTGGRAYDAARSGAEWWANVSDSAVVAREGATGYGKIALHWDKDEAIFATAGLFVHPLLSTVTFLCSEGAPTLVLPGATVSTEGEVRASASTHPRPTPATVLKLACLSDPAGRRHLRFDGRWLHGAPEGLAAQADSPYTRVTFLVNVWIGHVPGRCGRFEPRWAATPTAGLAGAPTAGRAHPFRLRLRRGAGAAGAARRTTLRPRRKRPRLHGGEGRPEQQEEEGVACGATQGGEGCEARLELALEQTAITHTVRLAAGADALRRALQEGWPVELLGAGAAAAADIFAASE